MIPASARATDGLYSMWVEAAIGQSQTENRGLVPPWVLDYGLKHPRNGRM